jgi:hypothetical protein
MEYNQLDSDGPKDTFTRSGYRARGQESKRVKRVNKERIYVFREPIRRIQNLTLSNL